VTNTTNSNIKISVQKISSALQADFKATNWMTELRYFFIVVVIPSILIMTGMLIFNVDASYTIGLLPGWFGWLIYTSCGTTHESRRKNICDILWCIDPYMFPSLPSLTRQNLLMKHYLNLKEFILFSAIQRLHLILGVLLIFAVLDLYHILLHPQTNEDTYIFIYMIGGIGALAFFTGGVHEDMKLHYMKVAQETKKFLWKYTFFVFLYSLISITVIYLSVFFIIRLVLQPS